MRFRCPCCHNLRSPVYKIQLLSIYKGGIATAASHAIPLLSLVKAAPMQAWIPTLQRLLSGGAQAEQQVNVALRKMHVVRLKQHAMVNSEKKRFHAGVASTLRLAMEAAKPLW